MFSTRNRREGVEPGALFLFDKIAITAQNSQLHHLIRDERFPFFMSLFTTCRHSRKVTMGEGMLLVLKAVAEEV